MDSGCLSLCVSNNTRRCTCSTWAEHGLARSLQPYLPSRRRDQGQCCPPRTQKPTPQSQPVTRRLHIPTTPRNYMRNPIHAGEMARHTIRDCAASCYTIHVYIRDTRGYWGGVVFTTARRNNQSPDGRLHGSRSHGTAHYRDAVQTHI